MEALHSFLKHSPMMAYLAMMAPRLVELHRVLKPTGSLYLHCDPTASAYLRTILDNLFGGLQILTVEGLLNGSGRVDAPPQINPFAMAAREADGDALTHCDSAIP